MKMLLFCCFKDDSPRIKLKGRTKPETDYINASEMQCQLPDSTDDSDVFKKYIAAMGPLKETVNDFWYMIQQMLVHVIIMATELKDKKKELCYQYWPKNEGDELNVGDGVVTFLPGTESNEYYTLRRFHLRWNDGTERTIHHFQIRDWDDGGELNQSLVI